MTKLQSTPKRHQKVTDQKVYGITSNNHAFCNIIWAATSKYMYTSDNQMMLMYFFKT